jgi:hypothetical protein
MRKILFNYGETKLKSKKNNEKNNLIKKIH